MTIKDCTQDLCEALDAVIDYDSGGAGLPPNIAAVPPINTWYRDTALADVDCPDGYITHIDTCGTTRVCVNPPEPPPAPPTYINATIDGSPAPCPFDNTTIYFWVEFGANVLGAGSIAFFLNQMAGVPNGTITYNPFGSTPQCVWCFPDGVLVTGVTLQTI